MTIATASANQRYKNPGRSRYFVTASVVATLYIISRAAVTAFLLKDNQPTPLDETLSVFLTPFSILAVYKFTRPLLTVILSILFYIFITTISIFYSGIGGIPQPAANFVDIILDMKFFICFFGFLFLLLRSRDINRELVIFSRALLFLAILNCLFVFRDYFFGGGLGIHGNRLVPRLGGFQPTGIWFHQFDSALCSMFGFYSAIFLWLSKRTWNLAAVIIILGIALILHFSTKEAISAIASICLLFAWPVAGIKSSKTLRILYASAAVFFVALSPISSLIETQLDAYVGEGSDQQARTALTTTSLSVALDMFPFGSGGGTYASPPSYQMGYSDVYSKYSLSGIWGLSREKSNFITDVFWPKILAQSGFFGFILFALAILIILTLPIRKFISLRTPGLWLASAITLSSIIASTSATPYSNEQYFVVIAFFSAYGASHIFASRRASKIET